MFMQIENITKTFGDNETLAKVSFTLPEGAKVGLVGANGSGKSTLLKIITGEVEPDSGRVLLSAETTIGYLPQVLAMSGERRIDELMNEAMGDLNAIESRMRTLEVHMASDAFDASRDDRLLLEYGRLQERYDRKGGYDGAYRVDQVMAGLGLEGVPRHKSMNQLSGGEQSRVGLASLLLTSPDLLLLDEPTNHLDFEAIAWLEQFLSSFSGAMLVVSHDRRFLNNVVHTIVEIDEHSHQAKVYSGSYDFYAAKKNEERVRWQEDYERQQDEIRELRRAIQTKSRQVAHNRPSSDSDKFLKAFKAGRLDGAISRNVRNAEEKLRRIEKDPIPRPPRSLRISPELNPSELVSRSPMTVSNLYNRYGSLNVLQDVSFSVDADARIAIVGPNGAGKSTLLQVLVGRLEPDSGEINIAVSTRIGYLDQQQETLTPSDTVYQAYCGDRVGEYEEIKAELLGYGLFTYPDLSKRVGELSVGQQRKLQIALLCASRANLLLLDEPTNHVSLDVLEQFEAALAQFEGPILAVSHDRQFLSRFANEVWTMDQGKLRRYIGSWDDYVDRTVDKVFSS